VKQEQFNCVVTIQTQAVTKDASGGHVKGWTTHLASIRAYWRAVSGNERQAAAQAGGQVAERRTEFVVNFRTGITASMRVSFGGEYYNIKHVKPFGAMNKEWLLLTCDTGLNNG